MDKILICLIVPSIAEKIDVWVPGKLKISELIKELANGVEEIFKGRYESSNQEMLCQKDPDRLLNPKYTLEDYVVKDGAVLVLL